MIFKTELEKDRTLFKTNFQTNIIAGNDGKSAYEIWLENGNEGTEQDFLNSLKGEDGADGSSADLSAIEASVEQNTADIAEIKDDIDMTGIGIFNDVKSACSAFYSNIGSMNGRIAALEGGLSPTDYIVEISGGANELNWYRKWNSGFIEQGGAIEYPSSLETKIFPVPFSDIFYFVTFSMIGSPDSMPSNVPCYVATKYTTEASFQSNYTGDAQLLVWYACGY